MPTPKSAADLAKRIILASRWLLLVFYGVLIVALAAYAVVFAVHAAQLVPSLFTLSESELILAVLGLVDASLVASLIVMVIISGYDNFVGEINAKELGLPWLGSLDAGGLKVKIATSIVAISSIQLLEIFLNAEHFSTEKIIGAAGLHLTFVVSALALGVLGRLTKH